MYGTYCQNLCIWSPRLNVCKRSGRIWIGSMKMNAIVDQIVLSCFESISGSIVRSIPVYRTLDVVHEVSPCTRRFCHLSR